MRSSDVNGIRRALVATPLDRDAVLHVLPLLGRDELAGDAIAALRRVVPQTTGQIVDVLLDPGEPFAVRRRLPRVLAVHPVPRAIEGLLRGLQDARSEIRQQCGRALARLHADHPEIPFDRDRVMRLVREEANRGKQVWEGQLQLDQDERDDSPLMDEVLRDRANRSLEHVFVLLSLALPLEPLRLAFAGLHTEDDALRATALDYLDSVLPPEVRGSLWPLLAERNPQGPRPAPGSRDALQDLIGSNQSIQINLAELRRRLQEGP
jgi:AAA family ATP:ADP antiporter